MWMGSKLNILNDTDRHHLHDGVWLNRGVVQAANVYEEFTYKIERENRFLQMLH